MSAVIEWSDPPVAVRGPHATKWAAVAEELKANPGKWGVVARQKYSSNAGKMLKALAKHGEFEVICRRDTARPAAEQYGYWARYVGPDGAAGKLIVPPVTVDLGGLVRAIGQDPAVKATAQSNVVALPPAKAVPHPSTQPAPKGSKVDPFECDLCDPPKVFTDRHTLRHHQRVSHRGAS